MDDTNTGMNPEEFERIVEIMRRHDVKSADFPHFHITLYPSKPAQVIIPPDAPSPDDDPIAHKVEEMTSLLKMGDKELVDRLFPDTIEKEDAN